MFTEAMLDHETMESSRRGPERVKKWRGVLGLDAKPETGVIGGIGMRLMGFEAN